VVRKIRISSADPRLEVTLVSLIDNCKATPGKALHNLRQPLGQQEVIGMNIKSHCRVFSIWDRFIGYPVIYYVRNIECVAYWGNYVCIREGALH